MIMSLLNPNSPMEIVVLAIIILVATGIVARIVGVFLRQYFKGVSRRLKVSETTYVVFRRLVVALIYVIGIIVLISIIPGLEKLTISLVAGAGFAAIVLGLAAQNAFSNIVSGIFLAIFQPFRVGDYVTVRDEHGKIEDITLRHTVIKTWDNRRLIIPNAVIGEEAIINFSISDPKTLWYVNVGISYDSDIDKAREIMIEEAMRHKGVMKTETPKVLVTELGDFAVNLRLSFWLKDRSTAFEVGCDIRESIKKRFDREGIEIPFPYRTIVYKREMEREQK